MSTYSTYSPRLHKHGSDELHHTFHSDIPFFGEDIGPISFRDWMWDRNWCNHCLVNIVNLTFLGMLLLGL